MWIDRILHGIDTDPVQTVDHVKNFGSSKNLGNVTDLKVLETQLKVIAAEIIVRLKDDREMWNRFVRLYCL